MDFGLWTLGFGLWLLGFVLRGLGIGFWTLSFGLQVKVSVYYAIAQNPKSLDFGLWAWGLGLWVTPDFGFRMVNFRFSTLTFGL